MALLKRSEFLQALKTKKKDTQVQVFLFVGERYLCREAADLLVERLLAEHPGAVNSIDGDREDAAQTLARLTSFSLLPGRQIFRITDSRIFHSKVVAADLWTKAETAYGAGRQEQSLRSLQAMLQATGVIPQGPGFLSDMSDAEWQKIFGFGKPESSIDWAERLLAGPGVTRTKTPDNLTDRYIAALEQGLPAGNILLLSAETVDKRQRFYTFIKNKGVVVDCSIATGASSGAQKEQKEVLREMMEKTLADFGKTIDRGAVDGFFERVGFHPVGVVMESEKLAHYTGDRQKITMEDLENMVGRNREDALFELTDAFGKRQLPTTLTILTRLLDQGIHSLAILATMRNYLKKQLMYRSIQLQPEPVWNRGMNVREFQNHYLPALRAMDQYRELVQGHPYALYMSFTKASEYSCSGLKRWLSMLLEAEFKLKGSPLAARLVLEELFIAMLKGRPKTPHCNQSMIY